MKLFALLTLAAGLALAADPAVEKAVAGAANELAQAQMKKDKATIERLLGDEVVYSHSSAMRETKAQHIAAVMKPSSKYTKIELTDVKVTSYGNTATLTCKALFSVDNDGKKADNRLSMLQVWTKRGAGWQLVTRWTTKMPQ